MGKDSIKWRTAVTFSHAKCNVSYADIDGVRIQRLVFSTRSSPSQHWEEGEHQYRVAQRKLGDRFLVHHVELVSSMIEAYKAGADFFNPQVGDGKRKRIG